MKNDFSVYIYNLFENISSEPKKLTENKIATQINNIQSFCIRSY